MNKKLMAGIVATLFLIGFTPVIAQASDGCGFGYMSQTEDDPWTYDEKTRTYTLLDGRVVTQGELPPLQATCVPRTWWVENNDDGFGSEYLVSIFSDDEAPGVNSFSYVEISCLKKKLYVGLAVDYPLQRGWQGSAQLKFGSGGKVNRVPYTVNRTFNRAYLNSPKAFTKSFLSSSRATFKVDTYDGPEVLGFPIADLSSHVKKFKSLGCPLK